ncbi:MAG: hypothetical protein GF355_05725 [Candidatus Eisenbacteria bacterium]|nr:hypothetical protein [Candidatus Eisenbacteria bacterium]
MGFLETLDGRSLSHLNGANIVTVGRLYLLPAMCYAIIEGRLPVAAAAYAVLALSDVLDGLWARWKGQVTKLGIVLDPLADAAFHMWAFAGLALAEMIPVWLLALVLVRYLLLIGGGILLYWIKGQIRVLPTPFGKTTGVLTVLATFVLLAYPGDPRARPAEILWFLGIILALTVLHVVAIGWVNLKLPVTEAPARTQVHGRWAKSLQRRPRNGSATTSRKGDADES